MANAGENTHFPLSTFSRLEPLLLPELLLELLLLELLLLELLELLLLELLELLLFLVFTLPPPVVEACCSAILKFFTC